MRLEGIHHVTCITGDAPGNVDFYTRVLGLRLVKKTVNQDDPTVYHLFYADEDGSAGRGHHVLRVPRRAARPGRGRDGAHRHVPRRLGRTRSTSGRSGSTREGISTDATDGRLRFEDPEGPRARAHRRRERGRRPLVARHPEIPAEHRAAGLRRRPRVRGRPRAEPASCSRTSSASSTTGDGRVGGARRRARRPVRVRRAARPAPGVPGAGTVHHVAWASTMDDHEAWQRRVDRGRGARRRRVIDRFWFRSVYFREPSGVLFEIATLGPGFGDRRGSRAPRRVARSCRRRSSTCARRSSRS